MLALLCLNATLKIAEQGHQQVVLLEEKPWKWQRFPMSGITMQSNRIQSYLLISARKICKTIKTNCGF
jgi:hypothetical protein